jgi:hypothetical protein
MVTAAPGGRVLGLRLRSRELLHAGEVEDPDGVALVAVADEDPLAAAPRPAVDVDLPRVDLVAPGVPVLEGDPLAAEPGVDELVEQRVAGGLAAVGRQLGSLPGAGREPSPAGDDLPQRVLQILAERVIRVAERGDRGGPDGERLVVIELDGRELRGARVDEVGVLANLREHEAQPLDGGLVAREHPLARLLPGPGLRRPVVVREPLEDLAGRHRTWLRQDEGDQLQDPCLRTRHVHPLARRRRRGRRV